MKTRTANKITKAEDVDYISNLTKDDITLSTITKMFGEFNGKRRFNPYDTIDIPVGKYGIGNKKNKNIINTTVGIYVFNKFFNEDPDFFDIFGYVNKELNGDSWEDLIKILTMKVMEDEAKPDVIGKYHLKAQWLMSTVTITSPTLTDHFLKAYSVIEPKKKELAKKYEKELKEGNIEVADKMQKELMDVAKEYLDGDPAMDLFDSKARSSFGNHYKNMYIMKGAIANPDPTADHPFDIALSAYNNGISKEEYGLFCNSLSSGPYHRAKKTEVGGYWEKLFVSAYQHIILDPPGSDCGTKDTIEVTLDKKNISSWMYSYVVDSGGLLTEITSKTMDKYIGKTVKMRFSSLCESKTGLCNHCVGNMFYRLGKPNIGVAMGMIASVIKNKNMKAFHDSNVKLSKMDLKSAFGE